MAIAHTTEVAKAVVAVLADAGGGPGRRKIPAGNGGENLGKSWENHGKPWETHGEPMEKPWKTYGKPMFSQKNDLLMVGFPHLFICLEDRYAQITNLFMKKMWPDHHRDYTASHVEKVSFESHEKWGTQPRMGNK